MWQTWPHAQLSCWTNSTWKCQSRPWNKCAACSSKAVHLRNSGRISDSVALDSSYSRHQRHWVYSMAMHHQVSPLPLTAPTHFLDYLCATGTCSDAQTDYVCPPKASSQWYYSQRKIEHPFAISPSDAICDDGRQWFFPFCSKNHSLWVRLYGQLRSSSCPLLSFAQMLIPSSRT